MNNRQCVCTMAALFLMSSATGNALASETGDLARATQNPVASLISVPFQNNTNYNFGPWKRPRM